MEQILENPWISALVILVSQVIFMFTRSLNVIYTAKLLMVPTIVTGIINDVTWLLSMSIGLSSVMTGSWQPIVAFVLSGVIGRRWAINLENNNKFKL